MASVYGRLGFDFDSNNTTVFTLSDEAVAHLNSSPSFLPKAWQVTDLAENNTGGYYKNPTANVYTTLYANTSLIFAAANTDPANNFPYAPSEGYNLTNTANSFIITLNQFKSHTDNISGVTALADAGTSARDYPYRESALGFGKFLIYLTYQTDGVANASPSLGSFTSLFVNDQLEANNTIIANDWITFRSSLNGSNVCNLNGASINTIISHIQTANTLIDTRRNHDINFFRNSAQVVQDFGKVSQFSNMGPIDTQLANNYIGSDKLVSRLNS
jgi:hypothetical protein